MAISVSEFDVLVPTALWLASQGCSKMKVSIARGQDMALQEQKSEIVKLLAHKGFTDISFVPFGPDIIAHDEARIWKVECKGLTDGAPQTVRNNFDRALASVVSYYDEPLTDSPSNIAVMMNALQDRDRPIRLVLALPDSDKYRRLLRNRVKPALRRRLDLWILIVDPEAKSVADYPPDREI